MISVTHGNRRWLVLLAALGLVLWLASVLLTSTHRASADPGTLLHVDAASNQIHLYEQASVRVQKVIHLAENSNTLDLTQPSGQLIFNCTTAAAGATANLGVLAPGELKFRLTGPTDTFDTGLASDNPDNYVHANLSAQAPNVVRMFWEDLPSPFTDPGEPDHNDCIVDVIASPIPVGGTTTYLTADSDSSAASIIGFFAVVVTLFAAGTWYSRRRRRDGDA